MGAPAKKAASAPRARRAPPPPPPPTWWERLRPYSIMVGIPVVITAGTAFLGGLAWLGKAVESGPVPLAGRIELQRVDTVHDAHERLITNALESVSSQLKQNTIDSRRAALDNAQRNLRGLQNSMDTAVLRYARTHDPMDAELVHTLQDQVDRARLDLKTLSGSAP